ncbi:MAG: NAD+ synthase [Proteobacteria bacterium]|nr:NAD+ synthase [Pseudomonadota bacterium]
MKIALAQVNPVIGDFAGNEEKIARQARAARERGCSLVVFPELSVCGYPPRDLLERQDFLRECEASLARLMGAIRGIGVVAGLPRPFPGPGKPAANAAVLFEDGKVLHRVRKRLLPTYDVFDEARYFTPGRTASVFEYKGLALGITICEDAWNDPDLFAQQLYDWDPIQVLADAGARVLINIAASPFHAGKARFRHGLMSHLAKKHSMTALYVNQVGGNDSLVFDGASSVHLPDGSLAARGAVFAEDLVVFDTETGTGTLAPEPETDEEMVYGALVTGTRDYVVKCGFSGAVVGLSGGIDSAITLCVAADALGPQNVTALFMPSEFTSPDNFTDTRELAENLGVAFHIVPIQPLYQAFAQELSGLIQAPPGSVTFQNVQARIRGVILMAFSNSTGALVLSTGNKSELAVGYCTLYGDMNGGLAVISDVPKTMVYSLCRHLNRNSEVIPKNILAKPPSAELAHDQKDSDDLPEYDVLDAILEAFVEDGKSLAEIEAMGHSRAVAAEVIRRVTGNEYKRRQAAPGLKITSKAFGEGRRLPIAQRFRPGGV